MNPNPYFQSPSPQPPTSLTREQAVRALIYQNPYGTAQELARLHSVAGTPFGFIHPHQAAMAGHQYAAYAQFHNQQAALNDLAQAQAQAQAQHAAGRNSLEPPRSVSPSRKRSSMLGDYDRDGRYMRAVSPSERRSPNVQRGHQAPGPQHARPPSPRQPMHHSSGSGNSAHHGSNSFSSSSRQEYLRDPPQDNYRPASKKARMQDEIQRAMNVSDVYNRGGLGKPELRSQDYVPRLVEAISPPSVEENTEVDRQCQQVEAEIRDLENSMRSCAKNVDQWDAELKAAEARKEQGCSVAMTRCQSWINFFQQTSETGIVKIPHVLEFLQEECERARKSHAELARPNTPENGVTGDVVRRIIAENRRIAESEHVAASKRFNLTVPAQTPCQHPAGMSDVLQVFKDFQKQRPGIILRLKKDRQAKQIRERYLKERYKQLSQAYVSRLEKVENNPKKKNREAKMREYYERQFPEIKKIRDDKLRDSRLTRKSDAEGEMSGTEDTQQDLERFHRNAVLVPMLLDAKDRSRHYYDQNRIVENCALDYKEALANTFWTQEEKDTFKEKYLQRPKDFGYISSFLKRKSVTDCVQYYYLTKRKENYKQLVKKQKAYRIRRGPNKRLQSADEPTSPNKMISSGMPLSMLGASSLRFSSLAEINSMEGEDRAITLTIVCPARKCQARRRVIKRLFKIPSDFPNYLVSCQTLEIPDTSTSCCKYCVYYIEKRLGLKKWNVSEIESLKKALIAHGSNWNLVAKSVGSKRPRDCLQYYRHHAAELAPPGENASMPALPPPDDEYSPWSRSSSDEAEEQSARDKIAEIPVSRSDIPPIIRMHSDDSNATLSADEMDDEPEPPPHQYLSTLPRSSHISSSFSPGNLPEPRGFSSEGTRLPPAASGANGPACVRDLIHSAIEKNLDKDSPFAPRGGYSNDFRRHLENSASALNSPRDRFGERRGEVDVSMLARSVEDPLSRLRLPNVIPPGGTKSPSTRPLASVSPARRDRSPLPEEGGRNTGNMGQNVQQAYQYSTRLNLATDFATSRQIHAEQVNHGHPGESRSGGQGQFENHQNAPPAPDPRFMQTFYSPYGLYLPSIPYSTMITPEYMEQLAQGGFPMGLTGVPNMMPQRGMAPQQRSIMLGTGKPGMSEENNSLPDRESASRLQTLAANRSLLRENHPPDKRGKPEVITIDESRRENHSPSTSDMRFHPAQHHLPLKPETNHEKEPGGSNVTAGSLIDVIIARQISTPFRGGEHNPGNGNNPPVSMANSRMSIKREEPMVLHKPFTLGEHIEQIIAKDFSKKDSGPSHMIPRPGDVASPLSPLGPSPVGGMYPQFPMQQGAPMNSGSWKRRARVDEQPPPQQAQAVYTTKPTSSLANTVEYEPISPPENRGSDSEEEGVVRNGASGDKSS